jgi:MYXO-CTERM domain-containing protein
LFGKFKKGKVMKNFIIAAVGSASFIASADAGVLGYSAFAYTASNGNVVIDVFTVVSNASDRLLNVYNTNLTTTQGGSTLATFVQQAGTATRGWKPDATTSTRSNIVDSFMTIGVDGGAPYEGQYYASAGTGADGSFTNWSSLAPTVPANAGWFLSPPTLPDNVAESMSGMSGAGVTRTNIGTVTNANNLGIWCAHLVMAPGTTSVFWNSTSAVKDGVTGATVTTTAPSTNLIPAPGALALLGLAGFSSRRRRA